MDKGKAGFIIFGILILIIVVGGYVLMKKTENIDANTLFNKTTTKEKFVDIRLDNTKEYIYFSNSNRVVDELDIEYQDVVVNFDAGEDIAKDLNDETDKFSKGIEYDDDLEDDSYNKISYAEYKKYNVYYYDNYISLVVDYYEFDRDDLVSYIKTMTYVFDKQNGKIYSEADLLTKNNLTKDDALDKIEEYIKDQTLLKEDEELDVDASMEKIDDLNLYVDKLGNIVSSILIKSDKKDYNETIILN